MIKRTAVVTGDSVDARGTTLPSIRCWSLVGHWLTSYADDTNVSPSKQNVVQADSSVGPNWLTVSQPMGVLVQNHVRGPLGLFVCGDCFGTSRTIRGLGF